MTRSMAVMRSSSAAPLGALDANSPASGWARLGAPTRTWTGEFDTPVLAFEPTLKVSPGAWFPLESAGGMKLSTLAASMLAPDAAPADSRPLDSELPDPKLLGLGLASR